MIGSFLILLQLDPPSPFSVSVSQPFSFSPSVPHTSSQTFLRELDKKLWTAADKLRSILDAAVYKHADPRSGGLRTASSTSSRLANRSSPLPDTLTRDQHPDLSLSRQSAATPDADFVMALPSAAERSFPRSHSADRPNGRINPPFNIEEWRDGKLEGDARWNRSEAELASHAQFYKNRGKHGTPRQTAIRECASSHTLTPSGGRLCWVKNLSIGLVGGGKILEETLKIIKIQHHGQKRIFSGCSS